MSARFLFAPARTARRQSVRLSIQNLESRVVPAAFTPGNMVIYRVGDGTVALSGNGSAVFLDEYTPTGTLVQSVAMPTTASGNQKQLIAGGNATAEGLMTRSADGNYLVMMGYARDLGGSTALSGTSPAAVPRVVGRVFADGSIDTSVAVTDMPAGSGAPRGAASSNGTDLWISTQNSGTFYTAAGTGTSTQLNSTVVTMRYVNIFGGQLYTSANSAGFRVGSVGTGLPTTGGQTFTNLPGVPASTGSIYGFFLADLDASVAGVDTLYYADDSNTAGVGGIAKYSLVNGTWTSNGLVGNFSDSYRGLTATVSGTTVSVFATRKGGSTGTGGGELVSLVDSTGYNGSLTGTPTLLATAGTNQSFRGVALAPVHANIAPVNTLPPTYSATEDTAKVLTGISIADDSGSAPIQVSFSVPTGTLAIDTTVTNGVTAGQVSGNGSGSVIITAPVAAINTTLAAAAGLTFLPVADSFGDVTLTMISNDQGNFGNIGSTGPLTDTDTSIITVAAVNDAPVFNDATFITNQSAPNGTVVGTVTATDTENDTITYTITDGNPGGAFAIHPASGQITVANNAAVINGPISVTVTATDNGTPNESDTATITINVNKPPVITQDIFDSAVFEDADPIVFDLAPVFADAEDADSALAYVVVGNSEPSIFSSVEVSGATLTLTLAPNANGFSVITVRATDTGGLFVEEVFTLSVTAVNDAPTLSTIGDVTFGEDFAEQTLNLAGISGGPANESTQTVTLVASSDNPGLIANPTVDYSGGSTGILRFTPTADAAGTAVITVTATDNGGTNNGGVDVFSRTFTIIVDPVNDAPTLDAIADVSLEEDSGEVIVDLGGISAGPMNESGQVLSVSATSDNTDLIPNPTVQYAGGAIGTLTFTPIANANGSATITVTVTDNGGTLNGGVHTFTRTFAVSVDPVNDAPELNDVEFFVNEHAADGTVVGTVSATDLEGDAVTYAITDGDPDGLFAIDPDTGEITVADSALVTGGPFSLTVEATDNGLPNESTSATVQISVNLAPTTTGIADQSVLEDSSETAVSLGDAFADAEDADADLTYSIVSNSNATLFDSIFVDGDTLDLLFTPAADANGSSAIRVRATDTNGLFVETEFNVTVDPVNDAPTLDPLDDIALNEDAPEQTVDLSGIAAGPDNESAQTLIITALSSDPSVIPNPSIQYTQGSASGTLKFAPVPNASGTATITVTVTDNAGTANGGANSIVQTFTVEVGPVADRPGIDIAPTPMLPPVPIKTTSTGAPIGTLLEHASDDDPTALRGMAITAADTPNGRWEYSTNNGQSWTIISGVSPTAALLLADNPDTRIRFVPAKPLFQGFASFSFKVWDQSNGAGVGSLDDTTAIDDISYSTATERAWVAVGKTKPKVDADGHPLLAPVREDAKTSAPFVVKTFLGLLRLETGASVLSGIAVSGADASNGKWQFNVGKGWRDVGTVSDASALLLRPTDRLRFMPNRDFDGQATLNYHTWSPTKGQEGTKLPAGGAAFSVATETAIADVIAVNDRPVLDLSQAATLNPIDAGQTTTAVTFGGSLMAATDVDSANVGVAITRATGQGTWEYSRDGGTNWSAVAPVSMAKALLLNATDMVRFRADAAGTAALSFRAWDQFAQFPGVAGQKVPVRGLAFGTTTEILTVAVENTAPTLDTSGSPTLPTIKVSAKPGAGALISSLLGTSIADLDAKALKGVAITLADNTNGKWQYFLGGKWLDVGTVSKDSALLLSSTTRIRFAPTSTFTGNATIQFKAWDRTTGQVGDRIDTDSGLDSFSLAAETATITVTA